MLILIFLFAALGGNYVNFGVFELYGDRALSDALDIALKMALSIPLPDILAFPKVQVLLIVVTLRYLQSLMNLADSPKSFSVVQFTA